MQNDKVNNTYALIVGSMTALATAAWLSGGFVRGWHIVHGEPHETILKTMLASVAFLMPLAVGGYAYVLTLFLTNFKGFNNSADHPGQDEGTYSIPDQKAAELLSDLEDLASLCAVHEIDLSDAAELLSDLEDLADSDDEPVIVLDASEAKLVIAMLRDEEHYRKIKAIADKRTYPFPPETRNA